MFLFSTLSSEMTVFFFPRNGTTLLRRRCLGFDMLTMQTSTDKASGGTVAHVCVSIIRNLNLYQKQ